MIALAAGVRVYLACGVTDMRKGMTGLAMLMQQGLSADPFDGAVFAFRGRRAGLIKLIWHDGVGLCMLTKRLEQGQFVWPSATSTGRIALTAPQLAALLDGCEWRALRRCGGRNSLAELAGYHLKTLAATRRRRSSSRRADRPCALPDDTAMLQQMLRTVLHQHIRR